MRREYNAFVLFGLLLTSLSFTISCKRNFPEEREAFSLDMDFTSKAYFPVLGRNTVYNQNFNNGNSSLPLSYRITEVRDYEGKPALELLKLFPVTRWVERYTGMEQSLAEIRAKRDTVMSPLWEIGEHNGSFTMWEAARSHIVKAFPDSGYVFDVEVSSSGGRRYFKNLKLRPLPEQSSSLSPIKYNLLGDSTRTQMSSGINVWFNKVGNGSTLTFKMLDPKLNPISLGKFNTTKWDDLVHGFNKRFSKDSSSITYDVAYPIPLVKSVVSKYTEKGEASVPFTFERLSFGGYRLNYMLGLLFTIYEPGDWEVIIYFSEEAPLFTND